jgi:glycerate 2-kinase
MIEPRQLLRKAFDAAVAAADPLKIVPAYLPAPPSGKTLVIGAGKAAASMAKAVEDHWPQDKPLEGLVITRYGHGSPTARIRVIEAGHPVPDEAGEAAAREIFARVKQLTREDLLLALVSGGGSSLLSLPVEGLSMAELKAITKSLLMCGASIQEINTVRKHLSAIQGGRLAAVCKSPVRALVISDVTGDDPTHIASGPCAPDPTTYSDALRLLRHYKIDEPRAALEILRAGERGERAETLKPGDAAIAHAENLVIATAHRSLEAAARLCEAHGVSPVILGDSVTGEAREVAKVYGALVRQIRAHSHPWTTPVALISGGETTVTVRGAGRGGRNVEFLLSLVNDLAGERDTYAIAADTDGIDGAQEIAGALATPDSLARAQAHGLDAQAMLADNDGHGFFGALGDQIVTGATRTNVNDFRMILVL